MLDPLTTQLFSYVVLGGLAFCVLALITRLDFDPAAQERYRKTKIQRALRHSDLGGVLASLGIPLSSYVEDHSSAALRAQLQRCRSCAMQTSCHQARLRTGARMPIAECPNRADIEGQHRQLVQACR